MSKISNQRSVRLGKTVGLAIGGLALGMFASVTGANAAACTPTGFVKDAINLTAKIINPIGTVMGDVDATGCNIGIYYGPGRSGVVNYANVHSANYYGIVNNGSRVDIKNSNISDIGETPFNGSQHGVGIYFAYGSSAKGKIIGNYIWNYQKGGIAINGTSAVVSVIYNAVQGLGPVNFIAQNGIQVGYGADADVRNNFVTGNSYTGTNQASSGGILVFGGPCFGVGYPYTTNVRVSRNSTLGNDVGIWFVNLDVQPSCDLPTIQTKNKADGNTVVNNAVNNTTGNGPTQGYQAGIADEGNYDTIRNNDICGPGYEPPGNAAAALFWIDATFTSHPTIEDNTLCATSWLTMSSTVAAARAGATFDLPSYKAIRPVK